MLHHRPKYTVGVLQSSTKGKVQWVDDDDDGDDDVDDDDDDEDNEGWILSVDFSLVGNLVDASLGELS